MTMYNGWLRIGEGGLSQYKENEYLDKLEF